jgi:hypothetical protein
LGANQQKILVAMAVTAIFATVGEYSRPAAHQTGPAAKTSAPDPFRILLGAGLATIILIGVAELGEGPSEFAWGLAVIAALTATLVYGKPTWDLISSLVGSSGKTAPPTTPTAPTIP